MKTMHTIVFVYDDEETLKRKYHYLINKIGVDNISLHGRLDAENNHDAVRWLDIRCADEDWDDIVFDLELSPVYA